MSGIPVLSSWRQQEKRCSHSQLGNKSEASMSYMRPCITRKGGILMKAFYKPLKLPGDYNLAVLVRKAFELKCL